MFFKKKALYAIKKNNVNEMVQPGAFKNQISNRGMLFSVLSIFIASAMDVNENLGHPPKKRFVDAHFIIPSQSAYTFLFHENNWQ